MEQFLSEVLLIYPPLSARRLVRVGPTQSFDGTNDATYKALDNDLLFSAPGSEELEDANWRPWEVQQA
jgi:hypothetical protein